jgi:hypothetical protein
MATTKTAAQKRPAFLQRANKRVRLTLDRIAKLGDLAGATDADKERIVAALREQLTQLENRFNGKSESGLFELK